MAQATSAKRKAQKYAHKAHRPSITDPDVIAHSASLGTLVPTSTPRDREGKVLVICAIMRQLRWEKGKTARVLAAHWKTSIAMIEQYSAEAHRRTLAEVTNPETITMTVGCALQTAIQDALASKNGRDVARLAKAWADISGQTAESRVLLRMGSVQKFPDSPQEQLAILDEYRKKLEGGSK